MSLAQAFADDAPASPLSAAFSDTPILPAVKPPTPVPLSWSDKLLASVPDSLVNNPTMTKLRGFVMGAADPSVGAAQLVSHLDPSGVVSSAIDQGIHNKEQQYEASRGSNPGYDWARLAGNVASPVNLVTAAATPAKGVTLLSKAVQGAKIGAMTGASQPLADASENSSFFLPKLIQAGAGAVGGAVLAPIASKVGDLIDYGVSKLPAELGGEIPGLADKAAAEQAPKLVQSSLQNAGIDATALPHQQLADLHSQVLNALKAGKQVDPAAILRNSDFQSMGMEGTNGQITRDPTQFARERNLRGVAGVGEPLMLRFENQNKAIQSAVDSLAPNADQAYPAGNQLIDALRSTDAAQKSGVDSLYAQARDNLGRAAPMDAHTFSTNANLALDNEMLGGVLPVQARNILNDVSSGKIPFNVNTAVQMDQTLSRLQRGGSPAEAYAIGKVRSALNDAPIADNVGEDAKAAFDTARAAARSRFQNLDSSPGIKAAANDSASGDDFVRKYILGGKVDEVKSLVSNLDPAAMAQAKAQVGDQLQRAAFGENPAGDNVFSPDRYAKVLRQMGDDKLGIFYSPQEIEQMHRIGRVGSYINSVPSAAPVNFSNTGSATTNVLAEMLKHIPGVKQASVLGNVAKTALDNSAVVNRGIAGMPAPVNAISPEQALIYSRLIRGSGVAAGGALGGIVGSKQK